MTTVKTAWRTLRRIHQEAAHVKKGTLRAMMFALPAHTCARAAIPTGAMNVNSMLDQTQANAIVNTGSTSLMMHACRAQIYAETVALRDVRAVERMLFLITKGDANVLKATINMGNNASSAQMLYALHVQATAATSVQRMQ